MEAKVEETQAHFRSGISGLKPEEIGSGFDEILGFMSGPPGATGSSSFTALLELPPTQAVELLVKEDFPPKPLPPPIFPSNITLINRASKFSAFASADFEINRLLSASSSLKQEPLDYDKDSHPNSSSPALSDQSLKSKRQEREKKVQESNKKSKRISAIEACEGGNGENLPYVHVRTRRGQATDSHSLAERARREKINARMKLLQELVPGCNKISGTAVVLDEIINHVQVLQRQVEFLSMRLAAVNPRIDFNLDALLAAENGTSMDHIYPGTLTPSIWPDVQLDGIKPEQQQQQQQQYQQQWNFDGFHQPVWGRGEGPSSFITLENSLMGYDSSGN